jgi:hypothetical protein
MISRAKGKSSGAPQNATLQEDAGDCLGCSLEVRVFASCETAGPRDPNRNYPVDAAGPWRHHHYAVGEQHGFINAVRDEQHGLTAREPQGFEIDAHLFAGQGVESPERLVHEQDRRVVYERTHD